jgi:15,16-dihydrobiliverdin:ferredoxin oxidoreductase
MRPQHLLASAAVVASVGAFSSSSTPPSAVVGGVVGGRRRGRLRWTNDQEALSELELLIQDLMEVNGGGVPSSAAGPRSFAPPPPSPGRSPPSTVPMSEAESARGMPWTSTFGRTDEADPLLYMPFWEWQLDYMKSSLANLHPIACTATGGADVSYNENREKRARIVNHCYASDEYRKIRMTYYDAGDAVQVFNSVWYPDARYNLPVLGIDLLSFNRKRYLAIVDFQPIHPEEGGHASAYEHVLRPIREGYDNLRGKMSSKFYDETQFFSREMLFARFEDGGIVGRDLLPAFKSYVEAHVGLVGGTAPLSDPRAAARVLERQAAYDTYSAERDPAAGLFASVFGRGWAEDFIHGFLFSLSERREGGLDLGPPAFGTPPPPPPAQGGGRPVDARQRRAGEPPATSGVRKDAPENLVVRRS